ncbi:MAG: RnfABCDGE type electron transport complex subunit B [Christensenellaceae bacterium]|jgi:Na+-translocating ferredoxin:NAD+ oxidoreductase RNF subunit RnfB|nr:RnfABCDGE type electron transport complex subunit B [Christensenellaceae bacterium]
MNWNIVLLALGLMGLLGAAFGIVLSIADKKFYVETDARVEQVRAALAGANCGACGFAGCDALAAAIVAGEAKANACAPAGANGAGQIAEIMGVNVAVGDTLVARVRCHGAHDVVKPRYPYEGYQSCAMAASLAGGPKACRYSCLGFGDCERACAFGAIEMRDGIAKINPAKCMSCGQCVAACPRNVIALLATDDAAFVACQNHDAGKAARAACAKACIACGRCAKACISGAVTVQNLCAVVDQATCTRCGACVRTCPTGCIEGRIAKQ